MTVHAVIPADFEDIPMHALCGREIGPGVFYTLCVHPQQVWDETDCPRCREVSDWLDSLSKRHGDLLP